MRKPAALVAALLLVGALLAGCRGSTTASAPLSAGPAACPTANTTGFAKTKFVLHAGLAFGTFHRYLYKPFKAGSFQKGADGRVKALVKAAATAAFDAHEVRLATEDVKANPTLCRAVSAPLARLASTFDSIQGGVSHGDTSGLDQAQSDAQSVESQSAGQGDAISESTDESQG